MCSKSLKCLIAILLISQSNSGPTKKPPVTIPQANKYFTSNLMFELLTTQFEENLIFSPLQVQFSTALLAFSANDALKEEMLHAVQYHSQKDSDILNYYQDFFFNKLDNISSTNFDITHYSKIVAGFQLNDDWKQIASVYFQAGNWVMENFDLDSLNRFFGSYVKNVFKNILQKTDVPKYGKVDTYGFYIDTFYINGEYTKNFKRLYIETVKDNFYNYGRNKTEINMLRFRGLMDYADLKTLNAKAIILPFQNGQHKLLILLPNRIDGLRSMEVDLATMKGLSNFKLPVKRREVEVLLPKIETKKYIRLNDALKKRMKTPFTDDANFSKLFDDTWTAKFETFRQASYLKIDKEGLVTANVLLVNFINANPEERDRRRRKRGVNDFNITLSDTDSHSKRKKTQANDSTLKFTVDHPFAYFLYTDFDLFLIGHYVHAPLKT